MPVTDPKKRSLPIVGASPQQTPSPASPDDKARRRLPVIQAPPEDDEAQDRPAWHWSIIGLIAIFLAWLPLASLVNALFASSLRGAAAPSSGESGAARGAMFAANALCFGVAALAGGYLVGRFGGRAGRREAAVSGALTAALAWLIALTGAPPGSYVAWSPLLVAMTAIGGGSSYVGGRIGLRARRPPA